MVVAANILTDAAKIVRQVYPSVAVTDNAADDEIIDLAVSFDGTWMKRGHTSAYGIGCVIDTVTGLVQYLTILSSYCVFLLRRLVQGPRHSLVGGTSGDMEVEAAEILWGVLSTVVFDTRQWYIAGT